MFADDELEVFYNDETTVVCTRSRPGEDDAEFAGILAVVDADQFDNTAMLGQHRLQYPTAAASLEPQDVLRTQRRNADGTLQDAEVWRVLRSPERVVDGAESIVYLTADPDA